MKKNSKEKIEAYLCKETTFKEGHWELLREIGTIKTELDELLQMGQSLSIL